MVREILSRRPSITFFLSRLHSTIMVVNELLLLEGEYMLSVFCIIFGRCLAKRVTFGFLSLRTLSLFEMFSHLFNNSHFEVPSACLRLPEYLRKIKSKIEGIWIKLPAKNIFYKSSQIGHLISILKVLSDPGEHFPPRGSTYRKNQFFVKIFKELKNYRLQLYLFRYIHVHHPLKFDCPHFSLNLRYYTLNNCVFYRF